MPTPEYIPNEGDALYATAKEMQASVAILLANDGRHLGQRFTGVMQFLLGYSTELYLKAALAHANVPTSERHGHDLLKLYDKADQLGPLDFINHEAFEKLVDALAPAHRGHSFRYLKPDSEIQVVKSVDVSVQVLQFLDDHLRKNVDVAEALASARSRGG